MLSRKHRAAALVVVAAVGLVALIVFRPGTPQVEAAGQPADPKAKAADEASVRDQNKAYVAALVSGDVDAVMAFWDPDGDYVDEAGKVTSGKENIAALFKKALPELKGSKISGKILKLKFLS